MASLVSFQLGSFPAVSQASATNGPKSLPVSLCSSGGALVGEVKSSHRRRSSGSVHSNSRPQKFTVTASAVKPTQLESLSGVVTDAAVPEGHKGLHGFLYGEGDADIHSGSSANERFVGRAGEDDGSTILEFDKYVATREAGKLPGVYAVYDSAGQVQYIGYSRNVVLSLKSHRSRVGAMKCASVRVKLFSLASIVSKAKLEEESQQWINQEDRIPAGNSIEKEAWERSGNVSTALQLMTEEERSEYEEKKLKMRKAMGENLYDEVEGEDDSSRTRRLKLLAATEGDDWSGVIDGQTKLTVDGIPTNGASIDSQEEVAVADSPPNGQIISPFAEEEKTAGLLTDQFFELSVGNVDVVLDEVRPYLISDGGNVEVVSVTDGVVALRLQGACGSCPSSTVTMKMGIERVLNEKFGPGLKGVVQVDQMQLGATVVGVNSHLEMLRPAIHNYGGFVEVVSVESCKGVAVIKYKGPSHIGIGIQAAIKDKFPDLKEVVLVNPDQ